MNFKKETYEAIIDSGHKREDVMFIGSLDGKYRINMDEFDKYSDFEYDSGYGAAQIAQDLIIYFYDNTYIRRGEYDGSEWWEYNNPLTYKSTDEYKPFKNLKVPASKVGWCDVEEIN